MKAADTSKQLHATVKSLEKVYEKHKRDAAVYKVCSLLKYAAEHDVLLMGCCLPDLMPLVARCFCEYQPHHPEWEEKALVSIEDLQEERKRHAEVEASIMERTML